MYHYGLEEQLILALRF
jgi:hypothetical protein